MASYCTNGSLQIPLSLCKSSEIWCCTVGLQFPSISKERSKAVNGDCLTLQTDGTTSLQNVKNCSANDTDSPPRRSEPSATLAVITQIPQMALYSEFPLKFVYHWNWTHTNTEVMQLQAISIVQSAPSIVTTSVRRYTASKLIEPACMLFLLAVLECDTNLWEM